MDLSQKKIGFLGCGSMAECILSGLVKNGTVPPANVYVCNRTASTVTRLCETYKVSGADAVELAQKSDIIMLGVKPYGITSMLDVIGSHVTAEKVVVSMAAGVPIEAMQKHVPAGTKIIRVMPNVPSFVGCGMTSVTPNAAVTPEELELVVKLFESIGKASVVAESAIHGVISVCGSSPAYVFMFMEALADGAVRGGIPRKQAYEMAAQAVLGSAMMMLETGKSPGELKDMVCSPGGTTIEAVRFLEKGGMRSSVIEAMIQAMEKSKEMEKQYQ